MSATVQYGLQTYGARMGLGDCLKELRISEGTFRRRIRTGDIPRPVARGRWPTEAIMKVAGGLAGGEQHVEGSDPFAV